MADPIAVHNGDSAAYVAFQLMDTILKNAAHAYREKDLVLDLYAECLKAAQGARGAKGSASRTRG
jgi:hypothetical protein